MDTRGTIELEVGTYPLISVAFGMGGVIEEIDFRCSKVLNLKPGNAILIRRNHESSTECCCFASSSLPINTPNPLTGALEMQHPVALTSDIISPPPKLTIRDHTTSPQQVKQPGTRHGPHKQQDQRCVCPPGHNESQLEGICETRMSVMDCKATFLMELTDKGSSCRCLGTW